MSETAQNNKADTKTSSTKAKVEKEPRHLQTFVAIDADFFGPTPDELAGDMTGDAVASTASNLLSREPSAILQRHATSWTAAPVARPPSPPAFAGKNFGHIPPSTGTHTALQTKLTVGAAHDPYEEEADQVAEQVMRMPTVFAAPAGVGAPDDDGHSIQRSTEEEEELQAKPLAPNITPLVQRTPATLAEGEDRPDAQVPRVTEDDELQTKRTTAADSFEMGDDFEGRVATTRGGGAPLPAEVRTFMEPRFGADFSGVRVHAGGEAADLNRQVSAQAFTLGNDIYLGEGKTDLSSDSGKQLLAHELTHVVQQGGGAPQSAQRKPEDDKQPPVEERNDQPAASMLQELSGGGQTLPDAKPFEEALGRNLANVRVHSDEQAALLTRVLGKKALTIGSHILIAPDAYAPDRPDGQELLAQQLAQVNPQQDSLIAAQQAAVPQPLVAEPPQESGASDQAAELTSIPQEMASDQESVASDSAQEASAATPAATEAALPDQQPAALETQATTEAGGVQEQKTDVLPDNQSEAKASSAAPATRSDVAAPTEQAQPVDTHSAAPTASDEQKSQASVSDRSAASQPVMGSQTDLADASHAAVESESLLPEKASFSLSGAPPEANVPSAVKTEADRTMDAELAEVGQDASTEVVRQPGQPAVLAPRAKAMQALTQGPQPPTVAVADAKLPSLPTTESERKPLEQSAEDAAEGALADMTTQASAAVEQLTTVSPFNAIEAAAATPPPITDLAPTEPLPPIAAPEPAAPPAAARDLNEEELKQIFTSGRTVEQDRAEAQQLIASLQSTITQQQGTVIAATEAEKAKILVVQQTESAAVRQTQAATLQQIKTQYSTAQTELQTSAAQQKTSIAEQATSEIAKVQQDSTKRIADLNTALTKQQADFDAFLQQESQKPAQIADQEAGRADGELEAAASQALGQGQAVAGQYGGEDPGPKQRDAANQVGTSSASDIRSKKAPIRQDLQARAREFAAKYPEYGTTIKQKVEELRNGIVPLMQQKADATVADLEKGRDVAQQAIEQRLQTDLQVLQTAETQYVTQIQTTGQRVLQQIQTIAQSAVQQVGQTGQTLAAQVSQAGQSALAAVSGQAEPYLPGVSEAIESGRQAVTQTASQGCGQLAQAGAAASAPLKQASSGFTTSATTIAQQAQQQAEQVTTAAQQFIEKTAQDRQQAADTAIQTLTAKHQEMADATLAELNAAIQAARTEVAGLAEKFRSEVKPATDKSIAEAKKPLTDDTRTRAQAAAEKAGEPWWKGVLRAIGDLVVGFVVIVLVAAVIVAIAALFSVTLGLWAVVATIGAILLVAALVVNLVNRFTQDELKDASPLKKFLLALSDTVGITAIYEGATNKDIATDKALNLSEGEQAYRVTMGTIQTALTLFGAFRAIRKPPSFPRNLTGLRAFFSGKFASLRNAEFVGWRNVLPTLGKSALSSFRQFGMAFQLPKRPVRQTGQSAGKPIPMREWLMGKTPSKNSTIGLEVQARMRAAGQLQGTGSSTQVLYQGKWYPLSECDMSHIDDAVSWWNRSGRNFGPQSPEVRNFMNAGDNYFLEPRGPNQLRGATSGDRYQLPFNLRDVIDPLSYSLLGSSSLENSGNAAHQGSESENESEEKP